MAWELTYHGVLPVRMGASPEEVREARVRVAYKRYLRRAGLSGLASDTSTATLKTLVRLVATGRKARGEK